MFSQFFCTLYSDRCVASVAWLGTILVVAHAAVHGWIKYAINDWYRSFYDLLEVAGALSSNSSTTEDQWISHQHAVGAGLWEFSKIAIVAVTVMPFAKLVRSLWSLRWRLALMRAYVLAWDANRPPIEGASQRVHEDSYRFAKGVELCVSTVLDSLITLIVFIPILTSLGSETACPRSMAAFSWLGPGWLVGVAIASSIVGLAVTMLLGHRLVHLEVENQKVEAVLRRDLVILETAPGNICSAMHLPRVAEDAGDAVVDPSHPCTTEDTSVISTTFLPPLTHFIPLVDSIRRNYDRLFLNFTMLNLWLAIFDQFNTILPYMIFAPLLFDPDPDKRILLGTLIQVSNGFDKVFGSLSVVAENWGELYTSHTKKQRHAHPTHTHNVHFVTGRRHQRISLCSCAPPAIREKCISRCAVP